MSNSTNELRRDIRDRYSVNDMAKIVAASEARLLADKKETILREQVGNMIEQGYRVEELEMEERQGSSLRPGAFTILVRLKPEAKLILPITLAIRKWWRRRVRTYAYVTQAARDLSVVQDGQGGR